MNKANVIMISITLQSHISLPTISLNDGKVNLLSNKFSKYLDILKTNVIVFPIEGRPLKSVVKDLM